MEEELISGYCRQMDCSRMVLLEYAQDGTIEDVDCNYPTCPFAQECQIGKQIAQRTNG